MMIDLTYLKTTTDNDKAIIKELLDLFIAQLPSLKKNIVQAFEDGNWQRLKEVAHKAKNSFEIVGAKKQADELKQIEKMAGTTMSPDLKVLITNFLNTCEIILDEIENVKL